MGKFSFFIFLSLLFVSCASQKTKEALKDEKLALIEPQVKRLEVPFTPQTNEYCGPTALKMVLDDATYPNTLEELISYTYSPNVKGSTKSDMLGAVRRLGHVPIKIQTLPQLLCAVAAGRPVVVFYNAGASFHTLWHFGVLSGYDLERKKVYLHAGEEANQRMNLEWFYERWSEGDHWAMAVVSVEDLPPYVNLGQMIENINVFVNLEKLDKARTLLEGLNKYFPAEESLRPYNEILL